MDLDYDLCGERAHQIGLIVLAADETIERDMRRLVPEAVELLVSRVPSGTHVTLESLAAMETELRQAASLFPKSAKFRAIGYGCTSGTAQIGASAVADAIVSGASTALVTEPVSALIAACRHLGVRRLGLLSPYIESVSAKLCDVLAAAGMEVAAFASFNESEEEKVARIAPHSIMAAAEALAAQGDQEALFMSCTNLRTLDVIETIETRIGVPVLTSNQVLAWDLLRCAGVEASPGYAGQLWSR